MLVYTYIVKDTVLKVVIVLLFALLLLLAEREPRQFTQA